MPKPFPDELYHYTGISGLKGILESQTLWATHYKYLNDAEEVFHFRQRLPSILQPLFTKLFQELNADGKKALTDEYGTVDNALQQEPLKLAGVMYETTFVNYDGKGPFAEPFFASFCTVDKGNERVANHGLLSQWRGYGSQGGYAIVFDWEGMHDLIQEEGRKWRYFTGFAGDVVYSSASDEEIADEFGEQIDGILRAWDQALRTQSAEALTPLAKHFISCACRYKHWGFSEEQELRFGFVPVAPKLVGVDPQPGKQNLPSKPVSHFLRNGTPVPYLNLFEDITGPSGKQLPIKRIIIGPHPEKEKRKLAVELLLKQVGIKAEVSMSEIPYLGAPA